jgi:uncharacterized protein GlcG (DUF336 family)
MRTSDGRDAADGSGGRPAERSGSAPPPMAPTSTVRGCRPRFAEVFTGTCQPLGSTSDSCTPSVRSARPSTHRCPDAAGDCSRNGGASCAEAASSDLQPLAVTVLDAGRPFTAFERQDGTSEMRCQIAYGKACEAPARSAGSRALMNRAEQQPNLVTSLAGAVGGALVPVPGGVIARDCGAIVVAVDIKGDRSENDERAAICAFEVVEVTAGPGCRGRSALDRDRYTKWGVRRGCWTIRPRQDCAAGAPRARQQRCGGKCAGARHRWPEPHRHA